MRSLFFTPKVEDVPEEPVSDRQPEENRADNTPDKHIKARRTKNVHFDRRIKSELHLEECLPWHFEKGAAYHCISHGDVDSLTYLRVIVKQQPVEYVLISTWCMAITDVKEVEKWLERKDIGHADFYVGEIFQGSYADVYLYLKNVAERFGSRVCIFRNHSKVMAGFGNAFDFVIESSANINTNPRTEQTCITIDTGLARFYKEFYDEINNFTKDFDNWKPYTLKEIKQMTKLFNKSGDGAGEIVRVLGLIDDDLDFTKWEPILPLGIRDLQAIIGAEPIDAVDKYYREDHADGTESDGMAETLRLMQQAVAMFTWLKVIPTLDAQHGTAGRGKHLGENETGMTALQEFKDEENIRNLAYEAVDALVELLDREKFDFWMNGIKKKAINRLLIQNKETFDEYYNIGSHRLFLVLIPMIREVQDGQIIPVITRNRYNKLIEGDTVLTEKLLEYVRRPLALLTIKKAVERLPVEVLPSGIVQVQQSTTVRDKLRAEKEARQSVANSLEQDAAAYLDVLQDIIRELDAESETVDYYVPGVTVQSKGITF